MAASIQLNVRSIKSPFNLKPVAKQFPKPSRIRCAAATTPTKRYSITLLPGDGIGPEVISVAKDVLKLAGSLEGFFLYSLSLFSCLIAFCLVTEKVNQNNRKEKGNAYGIIVVLYFLLLNPFSSVWLLLWYQYF